MSLDRLRGHGLVLHGHLVVDRDLDGHPLELRDVHMGYKKAGAKKLLSFGGGPFCRLRVAGLEPVPGVYALCRGDGVLYVGRSRNLRARFNQTGYGAISPVNCYAGGQPTNCKVNHLVLREARARLQTSIWIRQTDDFVSLEDALREELRPPWNGVVLLPAGEGPYPPP